MENNENINQNEVEENSLQTQTAFCSMCGKPIPLGEKLCSDCINKQMQSIQTPAVQKPKKERKPLSKKTKTLIISLSAIVLAALLAFGGLKLYQYIVQKNIDDTKTSVSDQFINANDLSFVDVDSDGNIIGFKYSVEYDEDTCEYVSNYVITKYLYNSETGKICDPGEDTSVNVDDLTENILLSDGYYYYDGETSQINLVNKETVKVNINKDKKIVSLEYGGYTFKKPDDKTKPITDDYLDYLSRNRDADDKKEELETRLRNSRFSNSGFNVPMDDALDTFFESYTVSVEADRNDENIYRIYVEGPCYGYSYIYYAAAAADGYGLYLDTENVKFTYEYSETDDEISVVDDYIDGHSLRYLYVIASLY